MQENIARVTVNPETKQILDIHLYERNLRFKCKRCAIYCCKLGGPNLSEKDIEKIRHTGHDTSKVIEPAKKLYGNFSLTRNMIKSKQDGSCIFLSIDKKTNTYECSIYDVRPVLCRLYPFDFERISTDSFLLKVIPCCKGLTNADGELVNERFIVKHLLESIYAIL